MPENKTLEHVSDVNTTKNSLSHHNETEQNLETYFSSFRKNIIGNNLTIQTQYHNNIKVLYADWTASGRNYLPIEKKIIEQIMPLVANTHTDTNHTGMAMTYAYHLAQEIIKNHVNASKEDVLISSGSGMTGVANKFHRMLGLKIHETFQDKISFNENERPVVFITHMEHHSNQTNWFETIADVVIVPATADGLVSVENFKKEIKKYSGRKTKIAAVTACSNVTGIEAPYMDIAQVVHNANGICFVDFACSAPYVEIDMHVDDESGRYLDAVLFSPHKFLGGPGSSGALIFNKKLYKNEIPDSPGGGTVDWTNPWGEHKFDDNIEAREDGGTPAFLQTIKTAMCIELKNKMGVGNIRAREEQIVEIIWDGLLKIDNLHVLADQHKKRLGVFSFYIDDLHHNTAVKMLNDKFGIQTRGGCSCAGTYGHYLLTVSREKSKKITDAIDHGDNSLKPGWIRMSIHPTHTNAEIKHIVDGITALAKNHKTWMIDYNFDTAKGEIHAKNKASEDALKTYIENCFTEGLV